jgi:hypothetical protein
MENVMQTLNQDSLHPIQVKLTSADQSKTAYLFDEFLCEYTAGYFFLGYQGETTIRKMFLSPEERSAFVQSFLNA